MLEHFRSKLANHVRWFLPSRTVRRFVRGQNGTAAIEFAIVAVPFMALIFAILETALVFFADQTLETAATDAGRLIMTGQAQTAGYTQDDFKKAVCADLSGGLFNCSSGVYVDVKTYSSFSAASNGVDLSPITNGKLDTTNLSYTPGGPGDIVVVRLYYEWPIYVSLLGNNLSDLNGDQRLLVATSVFRNEPYGS